MRLRIGHGLPTEHPVHGAMQFFADRLRETSSGAIEAAIFPNGLIGQEVDLISQAQAGKLDFVKASASVVERTGPDYRVFNMPFIFRDRAHWQTVASNAVGERILSSTQAQGLIGLTYYQAGARSFYGRKPVNHPDDLKGLRIRVQPSPTMERLMQLFGAEGVALAWENVYSALRTGLVDGAENSIVSLVVGRHGEVVKHFSFNEHTMVPDVFFVSTASWNAFTPAQRNLVRDAALASHHVMNEAWEHFEVSMKTQTERMGVKFNHPEKAPFIVRAAALKHEFAGDTALMRLIDDIERS